MLQIIIATNISGPQAILGVIGAAVVVFIVMLVLWALEGEEKPKDPPQ